MTKMRQWSLVTLIVVIAVLAGGWLLLIKPEQSHISSVKSQATTQQQANQVLLQEIAARQGQEKLLPHEQAQLQKLSTLIPTAPDEPDIIRNMSSAASGANVDLLSITPATATTITAATAATGAPAATLPSATTGNLLELPVALVVVGSYANLESYFQLLEKLPRALLVTQFSLCPMKSADGGSTCSPPSVPTGTVVPDGAVGASISANVFFSPSSALAPPGVTTLPGATTPTTTATTPATPPASPAATTTTTAPAAPASGN